MSDPVDIIVYHNPACDTSRNTLGLIRNAGIEPHVVEYLKTPPTRELLVRLIARGPESARASCFVRKARPYAELGLGNTALSNDALLDAMMAHPILINRPLGRLAPRREAVPALPKPCSISYPTRSKVPFAKEDGQLVVDDAGARV